MIDRFIKKFTETEISYDKIGDSYYLISKKLKDINIGLKPVLIGLFLGKEKNKFHPSLALLEILSKDSKEKVFVKDIGEMDFLYGKGLRKRHIKEVTEEKKVGFLKLIVNEKDECLGYGKITKDLNSEGIIIKNLLDRGDFLRREK